MWVQENLLAEVPGAQAVYPHGIPGEGAHHSSLSFAPTHLYSAHTVKRSISGDGLSFPGSTDPEGLEEGTPFWTKAAALLSPSGGLKCGRDAFTWSSIWARKCRELWSTQSKRKCLCTCVKLLAAQTIHLQAEKSDCVCVLYPSV